MRDPELHAMQRQLSTPGDAVPGGFSRRRFLQGIAVTGSLAMVPNVFSSLADAITPVGGREGILVAIMLDGGNDGLNMVCPIGESKYYDLRPDVAIQPSAALPLASGLGWHPDLPKLKARYDQGKVAVVRGVGQTNGDHSHFSSMANWMAGTATTDRTSGWLGRYLDGVADSTSGFRGVSLGTSIPLTMAGRQAVITAVPANGNGLFGADRSNPSEGSMFDAIASFGATTTGRGRWADAMGAAEKAAMEDATIVSPLYSQALPDGDLVPQLTMAARLINANLGIRVLHAGYGSFDTHDAETYPHGQLMRQLDDGIDAFFASVNPAWADRVTVMTFSEFGRRAGQNDSRGTDHGTAAPLMVIGDHVKGGLLGTQPLLSDLDSRGDLKVNVDFRSVYASVLTGWLNADPQQVLGGTYPSLDLFTSGPGAPPPPPPPPPGSRLVPGPTGRRGAPRHRTRRS